MFSRRLPKLSAHYLSTMLQKLRIPAGIQALVCQRQLSLHRHGYGVNNTPCRRYAEGVFVHRAYSTRGNSSEEGDSETPQKDALVSRSDRWEVDVDKELLRYNVCEFYPKASDEGEASDEEVEDFGGVEAQTSAKIVDVEAELERYNVDEFYGIELEEQHIRPVSDKQRQQQLPFELKRGVRGVFDLGELCALLRAENIMDVCAISVPAEVNYAEHLVIGTGTSKRHLKAVAKHVKTIWKKKRGPGDFQSIYVEGLKDKAEDWFAVDLGNIALHLMLEETREVYDLETLWTCGPDYDTLTRMKTMDQFTLPSPSELSPEADTDELFLELARAYGQKHASSDYGDINEALREKYESAFRFGAERIEWNRHKKGDTGAESVHDHDRLHEAVGEVTGYLDEKNGVRRDNEIAEYCDKRASLNRPRTKNVPIVDRLPKLEDS